MKTRFLPVALAAVALTLSACGGRRGAGARLVGGGAAADSSRTGRGAEKR